MHKMHRNTVMPSQKTYMFLLKQLWHFLAPPSQRWSTPQLAESEKRRRVKSDTILQTQLAVWETPPTPPRPSERKCFKARADDGRIISIVTKRLAKDLVHSRRKVK